MDNNNNNNNNMNNSSNNMNNNNMNNSSNRNYSHQETFNNQKQNDSRNPQRPFVNNPNNFQNGNYQYFPNNKNNQGYNSFNSQQYINPQFNPNLNVPPSINPNISQQQYQNNSFFNNPKAPFGPQQGMNQFQQGFNPNFYSQPNFQKPNTNFNNGPFFQGQGPQQPGYNNPQFQNNRNNEFYQNRQNKQFFQNMQHPFVNNNSQPQNFNQQAAANNQFINPYNKNSVIDVDFKDVQVETATGMLNPQQANPNVANESLNTSIVPINDRKIAGARQKNYKKRFLISLCVILAIIIICAAVIVALYFLVPTVHTFINNLI